MLQLLGWRVWPTYINGSSVIQSCIKHPLRIGAHWLQQNEKYEVPQEALPQKLGEVAQVPGPAWL